MSSAEVLLLSQCLFPSVLSCAMHQSQHMLLQFINVINFALVEAFLPKLIVPYSECPNSVVNHAETGLLGATGFIT